MRAIVATGPGGPEVLSLADIPVPPIGSTDLLVRVELAGVNFADINARRGIYSSAETAYPRVLGLEVYGTVIRVGDHVCRWAVGDRVAGFPKNGGYAEVAAVPEALAYRIPEGVDRIQAAAFPVAGQTAYHLLASCSRARLDDWILVTGAAGGVGSTLLRIARLLGHERIIAAAGSGQRVEHARTLASRFHPASVLVGDTRV